MKKLLIVLLIVCVAFAGVIGYLQRDRIAADPAVEVAEAPAAEPAAEAAPEAEAAPAAEAVAVQTLDMDKLYALHQPEEIVATIDGLEISWGEYYYWMNNYAAQVANYFTSMANYAGESVGWDEPTGEVPEDTYAKYVTDATNNMLLQLAAVPGLARENGVTLDEDAIAAQVAEFRTTAVGEDATDEEYQAALAQMKLPEIAVEHMAQQNQAFVADFAKRFGENGEKISDAEAEKFLSDKGYVSANHILIATVDLSTGEALAPEVVAEKKATAEKLYSELSAITDKEQRLARFKELKEEYCEDSGKVNYPDGYTFTAGTMTPSFEEAAFALAELGLSQIVESEYGYHIILRLPYDLDAAVDYTSSGAPRTARTLAADDAYNDVVSAYMAKISPEYAEGFEIPDLLDFVVK